MVPTARTGKKEAPAEPAAAQQVARAAAQQVARVAGAVPVRQGPLAQDEVARSVQVDRVAALRAVVAASGRATTSFNATVAARPTRSRQPCRTASPRVPSTTSARPATTQ